MDSLVCGCCVSPQGVNLVLSLSFPGVFSGAATVFFSPLLVLRYR